MKAFANLIDRLTVTPKATNQSALIRDFLHQTPDPERGLALGLLTGALNLRRLRPAQIRALVAQRADPVLLQMSFDYVGDLAETVSLLWPAAPTNRQPPALSEIVDSLERMSREVSRDDMLETVALWLDACEPSQRFVLLKLLTGGMVSANVPPSRFKAAAATLSQRVSADEIEEVWHALTPPFSDLFAWIEGRGARPDTTGTPLFRPFMLASPITAQGAFDRVTGTEHLIEYMWSGARVQWVQTSGVVRLYSRHGDDLTAAFPDLTRPLPQDAALDGQLMVYRRAADSDGLTLGSTEDLDRRLRRRTTTAALLRDRPAGLRVFDLLALGEEDWRKRPLGERRRQLEQLAETCALDLSPALNPTAALPDLHKGLDAVPGAEGLMLKPLDQPYLAGRDDNGWLKWPREALRFRAVLLYIQRAPGGPNAALNELTLGAVIEAPAKHGVDDAAEGEISRPALVPLGKVAPAGLTPDELARISAFARDNTLERFGPIRSVRAGLVLEVACDRIEASARRKSGLRLIGPRLHGLCGEETAWQDANSLQSLLNLIP